MKAYKVSNEKNTRILFLEGILKSALALEDAELLKEKFEESMIKIVEEEKK